jgi:DNA-binding NtrC family response regulator
MISILCVTPDKAWYMAVEGLFSGNSVKIQWSKSASSALSALNDQSFDLLITQEDLPDMAGSRFVESAIMISPMINCAVSSPLNQKKFHQAYEGLGVLMQLPVMPGRKEASDLIEKLSHIDVLQMGVKQGEYK